jgi:uncharacterized membrane protein
MAEELRQAKAALGEVGEMVKSGKLKLADDTPPPETPEDDSALIDRKELKKFAQGIQQTVAQAFVQTGQHQARQMRDAQIELLRGKLPNFDKHEAEIRGLLDKVDPTVASNPDTIRQVHRIVAANHKDEEITEAKRQAREEAIQELRDQGVEIPEDEAFEDASLAAEEEQRPTAGRAQSAKPVARPSGGVAPSGDASASRPLLRSRNERIEPLSREERAMASQFGFKSAEEYRRYADPNWHPDTQGSKGRSKF